MLYSHQYFERISTTMFDLNLLTLSLISLVLIQLLGVIFAKKPMAVREIARTRRQR
jgi:hypothetical protein